MQKDFESKLRMMFQWWVPRFMSWQAWEMGIQSVISDLSFSKMEEKKKKKKSPAVCIPLHPDNWLSGYFIAPTGLPYLLFQPWCVYRYLPIPIPVSICVQLVSANQPRKTICLASKKWDRAQPAHNSLQTRARVNTNKHLFWKIN